MTVRYRHGMPRRSASQVQASRDETLEAAVELAAVQGLEGVTIGALAETLRMSKSGLIGRFGSKLELQLAVLQRAVDMFRTAVYDPAARQPAGRRRLEAILDNWIKYLARPPFPGGCFLTTASVEFDARPGPLNDAVKDTMNSWLSVLEREATTAIQNGELPNGSDPQDVAFTLNALAVGANCHYQLHHDHRALDRTRHAMASVLIPR